MQTVISRTRTPATTPAPCCSILLYVCRMQWWRTTICIFWIIFFFVNFGPKTLCGRWKLDDVDNDDRMVPYFTSNLAGFSEGGTKKKKIKINGKYTIFSRLCIVIFERTDLQIPIFSPPLLIYGYFFLPIFHNSYSRLRINHMQYLVRISRYE